jgi:hypothetical protein
MRATRSKLLALATSALGTAALLLAPGASASPSFYLVTLKVAYEQRGEATLLNVTAPAKDSVWALGDAYKKDLTASQFLVHYNGTSWRRFALPYRNFFAYTMASSSADNVWIFGTTNSQKALALRWDGHRWVKTAEPAISGQPLLGEVVLGPTDVWLATSSAAYHLIGGVWQTVKLPARYALDQLAGSSDRNIWLSGTFHRKVTVYRWDDRWIPVTSMPHPAARTAVILTESARNVWISTGSVVLHYTGNRWQRISATAVGLPFAYYNYGTNIAPYGPDGIWLGPMAVWTAGSWQSVVGNDRYGYPFFDYGIAPIPGENADWLVGGSHVGFVVMRTARQKDPA